MATKWRQNKKTLAVTECFHWLS